MKRIINGLLLTLSLSSQADIVDLGNITRDTSTGLDWLDVTETRGLSYNYVVSQMGVGGDFEGWRHASPEEFDQLITNFGYLPANTNCNYEVGRYCDTGISGDSIIIEKIIGTLGDTYDAYFDSINGSRDYFPGGGGTFGVLSSSLKLDHWYDAAIIYDGEYFSRSSPDITVDDPDSVQTINRATDPNLEIHRSGHFLVQTSEVPVPEAVWLFGSALVGLAGIKRKAK